MAEEIQVLRPKLPEAKQLLAYLQRIDASRIYSNRGPLSAELEHRLARYLALREGSVICASSGTAALEGAILATAGRASLERPVALLPSFTFVATAVAAEACGFRVHFVDVDAESWTLDPSALAAHPLLAQTGLVIPVAPFGRPITQSPWCAFRERTGVTVVIDAAASFDLLPGAAGDYIGPIPLALSFHATKSFGVGEGGAVISTDQAEMTRVVQALNFGFYGDRESRCASTNGKMSEYHAAVGLAALDGWHAQRSALAVVVESYRQRMESEGLAQLFLGAPDISLSYALLRCASANSCSGSQTALNESGIDTRLWYGGGLHHHSYFATRSRDDLPETDRIAGTLLGLPMAPDLTESQIARVVAAAAQCLRALQ
jgi:dTDP-4-amino-4,6-dideoxygalactose transaminase